MWNITESFCFKVYIETFMLKKHNKWGKNIWGKVEILC